MSFTYNRIIRFADVDPAGIVFYPRYFEMLNETIEEWFRSSLGCDFAEMTLERNHGMPLVHVDADFKYPGKLYEMLDFTLTPLRVGASSIDLQIRVSGQDRERFSASMTIVYVDLTTRKATPLPSDLKAKIASQIN